MTHILEAATRYSKNLIAAMEGANHGVHNACSHTALNENGDTGQYWPCPTIYELGIENIDNGEFSTGDLTGWETNAGWAVVDGVATLNATAVRDYIFQGILDASLIGKNLVFTFDAIVTSGNIKIELGSNVNIDGVTTASILISQSGTYEYSLYIYDTPTTNRPLIGSNEVDTIGSIDNISIREITLPAASYLSIYDTNTNEIIELSSTGDVGENLVTDGTFINGTDDWDYVARMTTTHDEDGLHCTLTEDNTYGNLTQYIDRKVNTPYIDSFKLVSITGSHARLLLQDAIGLDYVDNDIAGTTVSLRYEIAENIQRRQEFRLYGDIGDTFTITNASSVEALPISTHYNIDKSHQMAWSHKTKLSDEDKLAIKRDPNLLFRVFYDGELLPSGLGRTDIVDFFGGNGNDKYMQNLSVDPIDILSPTPTVLGVRASVTDLGNDIFRVTTTDATDTPYGYIRLSLSGSSPDLTEDLPAGVPVRIALSVKAPQNNAYLAAATWDISSTYITGDDVWRHYDFIGVSSGVITDSFGLYLPQVLGTTMDVDMSTLIITKLTAEKIVGYTANCTDFFKNTIKGASDLALVKDPSGRAIATMPAGTIGHTSDGHLDTQWKPDLSKFSIQEVIVFDTPEFISRASTATYRDIDGVLQYAAIDEARYENGKLLVEAESTNTVLNSRDMHNTVYDIVGDVTLTADTTTVTPDGTTGCTKVTFGAGVITNDRADSSFLSVEGDRTASLYIKRISGGTNINIKMRSSHPIVITDDWVRYEHTEEQPTAAPRYIGVAASDLTVATEFLVCFLQEEAQPSATSYIPTEATAVTRAADIYSTVEKTETRNLTHDEDAVPQSLYYIDGAVKDYNPALPSPTVTAKLGQTALIGYPEKLKAHKADFKVGSVVQPPEEHGVYVDGEILVYNGEVVIDTP